MFKINSWIVGLSILFSQILICSFSFAQESKPIIFAGDQDLPPIEYLQNGKPTGMFNDLLQELSKVMRREIEHQLGVWKESQKKVLNGEADALTVFGITEERRKLYDFTEPIFPMEFALFVQRDNLIIHDIDDLNGKRVGITPGGFPRQSLAPKKQIHLVFIKNYSEGFRLLLSGEVDALALNKWVGAYTLQHERTEGIKVIQKPFVTTYAPMAVKKGNLKLLDELNVGIRKLKKAGTVDEIARRWSSQEVVFLTKEKIRRVLILAGMSGFIIVIFIITLWAITLRKHNIKLQQEIVERQRAKEALRIYQEDLENSVTVRTAELSKANEQIKASLKEKEVLLSEIHHRVKNNMQIIISLLRLQTSSSKDKKVEDALKESQGRVQAMSLVHGTLYDSASMTSIDFRSYIFKLAETVFQSYGVSKEQVELKVEAENISFGIVQAPHIGLLINELVSNSLKYAFPENRKGEIVIRLCKIDQDEIELTVGDNGLGIPEDFDWYKTDTLGLNLVKMLAEDQLDGTLNLNRVNGTHFTIRFKLKESR